MEMKKIDIIPSNCHPAHLAQLVQNACWLGTLGDYSLYWQGHDPITIDLVSHSLVYRILL